MAALECGVDVFAAAEPAGGMAALRAKSIALADLFIERVEARCAGHRPGARHAARCRDARQPGRASPTPTAIAIMQALIARGVIGDFRAGEPSAARDGSADPSLGADLLRFGFTPLYTRFVDVWDAVEQLHDVLESGDWRDDRFARRAQVT